MTLPSRRVTLRDVPLKRCDAVLVRVDRLTGKKVETRGDDLEEVWKGVA
jgi:hypothetical protein